MFATYQEEQPICTRILEKTVNQKKYSHAYLFETNGYNKSFDLVLTFVKTIFCSDNYSNKDEIINKIDKNIFSELYIINPDGYFIKKEQVDKLEQQFKNKPIESNYRVYIINQADRFNASSANTILKFLEEPEKNIIAILITENTEKVLETIKSRCQIVKLFPTNIKASKEENILNDILNENKEEKTENNGEIIDIIVNFIETFEQKKIETILYTKKLWHKYIKNKDDNVMAFKIILLFYQNILNYKTLKQIKIFKNEEKSIISLSEKLRYEDIVKRIDSIMENNEKMKYNVNSNLLIDKLIIDWSE
ncbi:MAG: hypothetical protein PHE54_00680 [Bacilli bacterium]|nr:hypothetical protein [Bacilli bacterium]